MDKTIPFMQKRIYFSLPFCFSFFSFLFLFITPEISQAQMCLPSWKYRVPVVINNAGNGALTNYQVKMTVNTATLVTAGKMRADGGDIRFTESNCCTPVCHWVEKGMNTVSTTIWVKMTSLPAGGLDTVYLHYGDTTQTSTANGDCVFEFFDDFSGTTLNLSKWTVRGTPGVLTVGAGQLTFQGNGNWEYIRSNTTFTSKVKIHDVRRHTNLTGAAGFVLGHAGLDNRYTFRYNSTNLGMAVTTDTDVFGGNAWQTQTYPLLPYPTTSFNTFEFTAENVANAIQLTNICNVTAANCNSTLTNLSNASASSFYVGYSSFSNITQMFSESIFVRKFTAVADPTSTVGSEFSMPLRPLATLADADICFGTTRLLNAGTGHFSYLWNSAATSQTANFTFPPNDTIWCTMVDGMGCTFTDSVIYTVLPLPSEFISPAAATVCIGASQTFDAGSDFVSWDWNTSDTIQMITVSSPMDYIATVEDTNGCVGSDTVTLANFPQTIVSISPNGTFNLCIGDTVDLDAGAGFNPYVWSTGDSTQVITVDTTGIYFVVVTDSNSCSGTDTVSVTLVPLPSVSITPDSISVCEGIAACLDAGPGFSCYIWSDASTTQIICPVTSGVYSVTVCDNNGCMDSDTANVIFLPAPNAIITQNNDTLTCSPAVSYQWLLNGAPLAGETNQTYLALVNASYSCVITDANGCTDTSNVIGFVLGRDAEALTRINIYPNPVQHVLHLDLTSISGAGNWQIVTMAGVVVQSGTTKGGTLMEASVSDLSAGMYFIEFVSEDLNWGRLFVKE
jgi:Domain of unknown function (DUF2341)/Secretion system C-terminal sorting domain